MLLFFLITNVVAAKVSFDNILLYSESSKFSPNKGLLKIEIYDEIDNLIFEDKLDKDFITERVFDISQLPTGKYKIAIRYAGRTLIKEILYSFN